ncbi:hypothetical protein FACS1894116_07820 [Betaproteobacteria bacterium]|nr:hypothetical protein FACS1894116_07820 [Betaproteobacteria bacterium]GHT97831.1 hypothetical protein FACS1894154_02080 [Betaproteobacteria bacterium]GHU30161.1 hypothetical protein FACS189497_09480 [Betaproteobacteria bacterium]
MSRLFQSFTLRLSIVVLVMAGLTAITLYEKEVSSVLRLYANMDMKYTLTDKEIAHFREAAFWYFFIFSLPLIPLVICAGKKHAQIAIAILSAVVLLLAAFVSPGGDQKGCDECLGPILLSVASTILISLIAPLWIAAIAFFSRSEDGT